MLNTLWFRNLHSGSWHAPLRTSPYHPQSSGTIRRFHRALKRHSIRHFEPFEPEQAREVFARFVEHYDHMHLRSTTGDHTPSDMLAGKGREISADMDRKLDEARALRRQKRHALYLAESVFEPTVELARMVA